MKGKPFIEDISARLPSAKLNVQFKGPDILLVRFSAFSLQLYLPL